MSNKIKFLFIVFSFYLSLSCSQTANSIEKAIQNIEILNIDSVEKTIIFDNEISKNRNLLSLLDFWFNNRIKVTGIDGKFILIINKYSENITNISDGKKIELLLEFTAKLDYPVSSLSKTLDGSVSSYSTITGDFSLKDVDILVENSQLDLVNRLNRELKKQSSFSKN